MARTEQGATLTEQHRLAQLQIRARALRDFTRLWPIWKTDDPASFPLLVTATLPLVRAYYRISAAAAASYYQAFRAAERVTGTATPRLAAPIGDDQLAAALYSTGLAMTRTAVRVGQPVEQARQTALVRTSGALTRLVFSGGRGTLLESVAADRQAVGWARVTDGAPCAFCAMLAGRGPVYKTEESASFHAHDHCGCTVEPFYRDSEWPGRGHEFGDLYDQATREARASGQLDRGTSNDLLNAFRRAYDDNRPTR